MLPLAHLADPSSFRIEGRRWRAAAAAITAVALGAPYYIWGRHRRILGSLADRMS